MKRCVKMIILAVCIGLCGCYQETTTEPAPPPSPTTPADDGGGSGGGGGTADSTTVNIDFTVNYGDDWRIVVQIDNHKDKIKAVRWGLFFGNFREQASSITEPEFDVSEQKDRCGVWTVRLEVLELIEGYAIGSQTDRQDLDVGQQNPEGCQEPTAKFSIRDYVCETGDVVFDNLSIGPEGTTYLWEFGDGSTSREESPIHRYEKDGEVTIILTATATGGIGEAQKSIRIVAPAGPGFTVSCTGLSCRFDSSSPRSSGTIDSSLFEFGDGSSSTSRVADHTYSAAGDFQPRLSLTNECTTTEATESISVTP